MSALPKRSFTPEEYLILENQAAYKSQYVAGEIYAMAGTEPEHVDIVTNIDFALKTLFGDRPCKSYTTDLRVRVETGEMYTYPDVVALRGEPKFDRSASPAVLLNPQVIFEVLSPSTEGFDRGDKFNRYGKLESLTDYVLVSSERMGVEHFVRQSDNAWTFKAYDEPEERLALASIDCELPLAEIYDRVAFPTL
jgi:Uma2 family endonuclease